MSVIQRATDTRIQRAENPRVDRGTNEVSAAYAQAGYSPQHDRKSWYGDIYINYQNNEC